MGQLGITLTEEVLIDRLRQLSADTGMTPGRIVTQICRVHFACSALMHELVWGVDGSEQVIAVINHECEQIEDQIPINQLPLPMVRIMDLLKGHKDNMELFKKLKLDEGE